MEATEPSVPSSSGAGRRLLLETRAVLEIPRWLGHGPGLLRRPPGDGRGVMVLPGFGASDRSTGLLRAWLRRLGYRAHGWGLGRNSGDVGSLLPRVIERAERLADATDAPISMVGWSLGGVLARETARERPERVGRVVTLGTPVVGGPKYTLAARHYTRRGYDLDAIESAVAAREAVPIRRPITAVYSRTDGVVDWRACIDRHSPDVEHVEVDAAHFALGFSAPVLGIVADRLALDVGAALASPGRSHR